jgi:NAD(P)-dependent dehydrogenase (short-subunit alcohol dehydrogenase family)
MFRLDGKTAIVTGGAHGIGRAIATVFAEAGASVTIFDIDAQAGNVVAEALRQAGHACTFAQVDVVSEKDVRAAVAAAAGAEQRIDIVCNNAAYLGEFHDLLASTADEWEKSIKVDLRGTVNVTRAAVSRMIERRSGSIINISSVQGLVAARDSIAYSTMKTALIGFTRSLAYDYGKHNIRANAICPGAITTRISPRVGSELHDRQISKTMLRRVGEPREVAYAALFLASDESAYVTGVALPVDGGWTAI